MSCIRPATPGFLITLAATVCLALASFSVPYLQSIYFLKASISVDGFSGDVTFGTLGYCLQLSNGTTCSKPSIGYELDINSLVGNNLPVQIPQVAVKWLTYVLFLHVVALVLSAGSAFFGLLAHVREMSMTCCSTFVSGFAATVALVAFIFDLVLFFVAKSRISSVGTASIGVAVWLTLAAWILLFFSGCFFTLGRCCINRRSRGLDGWSGRDEREEEHRLDAVRAEAERKALQAKPEGGLPAFHETQPLAARVDGDAVYFEPYKDNHAASLASSQSSRAGYAPAPTGTRAIDDYYSTPAAAYPPQAHPKRQNSATTASASLYPSTASAASPPPRQPSHAHYPSASYHQPQPHVFGVASPPPVDSYYNNDPSYGHGQQASGYSAVPIHHQQPSGNSNYSQQYTDPYARHVQHQASYHSYQPSNASYNPQVQADNQATYHSPITQQRSYTLGGDGYGSPPPPQHQQSGSAYQSPIIAPINTNVGYASPTSMSPTGPRPQPSSSSPHLEDAPPSYDDGNGHWAH
ncbi:SUR7/PalI family domain containing protein [Amanita muscaria]